MIGFLKKIFKVAKKADDVFDIVDSIKNRKIKNIQQAYIQAVGGIATLRHKHRELPDDIAKAWYKVDALIEVVEDALRGVTFDTFDANLNANKTYLKETENIVKRATQMVQKSSEGPLTQNEIDYLCAVIDSLKQDTEKEPPLSGYGA